MKTIPGKYFDGITAAAHDVQLFCGAGVLSMVGQAKASRFRPSQIRIGEPFANASLVLEFADGTHCEIAASERSELLGMLGYRRSLIERWQARWQTALVALVLLLAMGVVGYVHGLPALSEWLVAQTPDSADLRIGDTAQEQISKLMKPSRFTDVQIKQVEAMFDKLKPAAKRMPVRLLVRNVPAIGPNAFALPNGTIVMTDDLLKLLVRGKTIAEAEHVISGVLLHEIAHVEKRHTMRALSRASLVAGASWFLFGDFSAVAAGVPAMLEKMSYSRAMETEADDFAIAYLKQVKVSPSVLAVSLIALHGGPAYLPDEEDDQGWWRGSAGYMSSHPGTRQRVERIYAADPAGKEAAKAFVQQAFTPKRRPVAEAGESFDDEEYEDDGGEDPYGETE